MKKTRAGNYIVTQMELDDRELRAFENGKKAGLNDMKLANDLKEKQADINLLNAIGQSFDALAHAVMAIKRY